MNKETQEKSDVALREEEVLAFWREHDIFKKSVEQEAPQGDFVFYDGPPFATGLPHYGHILASTIKDAVPRFWTMNGYRVRRTWGWDCHGLPLENLIEKKLGLATKRDIEEYGVKNFNEAARGAVLEFADDWKEIIPRMGRWADMESDYKTMDSSYTESVWWVFKSLHEKGLVYEGFKSMHLCPRCGTTLSNFEVNQGYQDIKDIAVTVKLPLLDEAGEPTDTSLLVWTTTPWTLPGNMAAAVHKDADYVTFTAKENTGEQYIMALENWKKLPGNTDAVKVLDSEEFEIVATIKGSELVGRLYQPPFNYWQKQEFENKKNAWKIYHADYVEIGEEGTGAVHLAPAYGEEDMELAKVEGIPIQHHVDAEGHFMAFVEDFALQLVKPKDDDDSGVTHLDADIEVLKKLQEEGKIFKKENITHSYPHCWRCDTPLLNYATTSWFVEVTKIKDELVNENNKVHWVPDHVGKNRFGKWLEGARDWAVSRQRYWGAPLPVWRNPETKEVKVFGSLNELQEHVPKSGNQYFLMRHGESESNVKHVVSSNKDNQDGLTEKGREQVNLAATKVPAGVDVIIHSGFQRTHESAEIIAQSQPNAEIVEDDRLRELDLADEFEGKAWHEYNDHFSTWSERYTKTLTGSENRRDVQIRMGELIFDLEQKYKDKKILLVGHAGPLFALECATRGLTPTEAEKFHEERGDYFFNAAVESLDFTQYPHNDNYELDYHRPYIDDIELYEDGVRLERVPDVFDCWFESGSMPYGQHHYPFAMDKEHFCKEHFPAQFIAEGLDQTRGWFYSLIVLGTALFGKSPYENVIVNGLVLAEDGKKMSKKLQNYPDPMELADRVGADSMRYYMLSAPIMRAEDLNFSEKEVLELQRKNIGRLHNVLAMYQMYADGGVESRSDSTHVLDQWIISRLNELINEVTTGYQNYELDKANRPITDFIDDLSVWYLRRSRDRLKGEDEADKQLALATLRYVLKTVAQVMAPAMPFYAEHLWQRVKMESEAESVHLSRWAVAGEVNETLLADMKQAREVVNQALQARVKADIKVRQPIASVTGPAIPDAVVPVVLEEVNAQSYQVGEGVSIDTTLTPKLIEAGYVREFIRGIQEMRKECGFNPQDSVNYQYDATDEVDLFIKRHQAEIDKAINAIFTDATMPTEGATGTSRVLKVGDMEIPFSIWKSTT